MSKNISTEELREMFVDHRRFRSVGVPADYGAEFDEWLESVKAEAFQEGVESHEAEAERWYFPQGQGGGTQ